jgi:glutamate racemase
MSDQRPIGILDSGLGGLTVAREVCRLMAGERIVYFGDTASFPYGSRSDDVIRAHAKQGTELLTRHDIKLLLVACNTISAVALDVVERYARGIPVIGSVLPGARAAVLRTADRKIGAIGTSAAMRAGAYRQAIGRIDATVKVYEAATPLLVPLVEEQLVGHDLTRLAAQLYLYEMVDLGVDCLILGCTHLPPLFEVIQGTVGTHIQVIDSALWAAKEAQDILTALDHCSAAETAPRHSIYVSEMPFAGTAQAEFFFGAPVPEMEVVDWNAGGAA